MTSPHPTLSRVVFTSRILKFYNPLGFDFTLPSENEFCDAVVITFVEQNIWSLATVSSSFNESLTDPQINLLPHLLFASSTSYLDPSPPTHPSTPPTPKKQHNPKNNGKLWFLLLDNEIQVLRPLNKIPLVCSFFKLSSFLKLFQAFCSFFKLFQASSSFLQLFLNYRTVYISRRF